MNKMCEESGAYIASNQPLNISSHFLTGIVCAVPAFDGRVTTSRLSWLSLGAWPSVLFLPPSCGSPPFTNTNMLQTVAKHDQL